MGTLILRSSAVSGGGGLAFPASYNDPVFTGMTNLAPGTAYQVTNGEVISNKQVADDSSGNETFRCSDTCTLNYVRMRTREGPRFNASVNDIVTMNWVYIEHYAIEDDHSDGIQGFAATGNPNPKLVMRNCHINNTNGHVGLFAADAVRMDIDLENVLFTGSGQYGLRLHDDLGSAAMRLWIKDCYFTQDFSNSDIFITTFPPTVMLWENVRECTFDGTTLVPGNLIPNPLA